jgi:uncharacterized membrane protein
MARLAARGDAPRRREEDGVLRVLALGPNYEGLLAEAFEQIRESSAGNVAVLARLLDALETLERVTTGEARRAALADQVERVRDAAGRHVEAGHARGSLDDRASGLLRRVRRSVRAPRSGTAAIGARR